MAYFGFSLIRRTCATTPHGSTVLLEAQWGDGQEKILASGIK